MSGGDDAQDTPTHRLHVLQVRIDTFQSWVTDLQARRNLVVEKIERVKANNKLTEAKKRNKQLDRIFGKLERLHKSATDDIDSMTDELNKARALFWELSDGEVLLERTEKQTDGGQPSVVEGRSNTPDNAQDRRDTETSTS